MSGLLLFPFYIYSFISYNSEIQNCCIQNFSYKDVFNEKNRRRKKKLKRNEENFDHLNQNNQVSESNLDFLDSNFKHDFVVVVMESQS